MADAIEVSRDVARRFVLMHQGLFGPHAFRGKAGALEYVRQAGCIQFDPVDVVGRNADLTLQSRVLGFRKRDLYNLLYRDRSLVDYADKELAIVPVGDWPHFSRDRELCRRNGQGFEGLSQLEGQAIDHIRRKGKVTSSTLPIDGQIAWHSAIHWSGNLHGKANAARSVLEQLYSTGELVIHHKDGTRKWYDLAERHIPEEILRAPDPLPDDADYLRWRVYRRIGAVGLLWNRQSSAFLGIRGLGTPERTHAFDELLERGNIAQVRVEGMRTPLYLRTVDLPTLERAMGDEGSTRCEFLAPLDPMLWDRDLTRGLFDFSYTWEIYTPRDKRRYGYYVLPVLWGERLVGRIEPYLDGNVLRVRGLWLEDGVRRTKRLEHALGVRLRKFARFNDATWDEMLPS